MCIKQTDTTPQLPRCLPKGCTYYTFGWFFRKFLFIGWFLRMCAGRRHVEPGQDDSPSKVRWSSLWWQLSIKQKEMAALKDFLRNKFVLAWHSEDRLEEYNGWSSSFLDVLLSLRQDECCFGSIPNDDNHGKFYQNKAVKWWFYWNRKKRRRKNRR